MCDYSYADNIRDADDIFSPNAKKLEKNVQNLSVFADLLTKSSEKATEDGATLGGRCFTKTIGECKTGEDRYMFINNETEDGLLNGLVDSLDSISINFDTSVPSCQKVRGCTRTTVGEQWRVHHIPSSEFQAQKKAGILEAVQTGDDDVDGEPCGSEAFSNVKKDPIHNLYIGSVSLLGLALLFKIYAQYI
jgi:hypothetical protein